MFRTIRLSVAFLLLAATAGAESTRLTTVILVRHGEKTGPSGDVHLSEAGLARAHELARILAGTRIDAIYTTAFHRTRETIAPLAGPRHLDPITYGSGATYAADLAARIRKQRQGQTVVVVGHSNTTPEVMAALGVSTPPEITDPEYDNLYIVTLAEGSASALVSLRYGAQSSMTKASTKRPLTFLALGDSYTIGESVPVEGRWPMQLAAHLREAGMAVTEPQIIARTGWTTSELNAAIDEAAPKGPYDLVTLLIGVNNQYRKLSTDDYRREFAGLLKRAVGFAGGKAKSVVVVSIPDWGVTPFAEGRDRTQIAAQIDQFNSINREESGRAGVRYVDITPVSKEAATNSALTAADHLHPSAEMYRRWTALVLPEAKAALAAQP